MSDTRVVAGCAVIGAVGLMILFTIGRTRATALPTIVTVDPGEDKKDPDDQPAAAPKVVWLGRTYSKQFGFPMNVIPFTLPYTQYRQYNKA